MTSLESLDREIKKVLSNVPPRTQFMERRLEYWNSLHMVWGLDQQENKFELKHVPSLEVNADRYLDGIKPGDLAYMADLCAFCQRDVDEEYFNLYCATVRDLREIISDG